MNLLQKALAIDTTTITDGLQVNTDGTNAATVGDLINTAITWLIWIAGILAFVYLIYSGILYLTAAGNPDAAKKGQQGIINAVIGIVIIVLAYVILQAVSGTANNAANGGTI